MYCRTPSPSPGRPCSTPRVEVRLASGSSRPSSTPRYAHHATTTAVTVVSPPPALEAFSLPTLMAALEDLRKDVHHERRRREAQDTCLRELRRDFRLSEESAKKKSARKTPCWRPSSRTLKRLAPPCRASSRRQCDC